MIYQRFTPAAPLARWVECLWYLRTLDAAAGSVQRIVPDGCAELIFNLRDPFRAQRAAGVWERQPRALLVGQISRCLLLEPTGGVEILAARFTPAGASAFFGFGLQEIANGHAGLDALGEPWRGLEERLQALPTTAARLRELESTLLRAQGDGVPVRVPRAVERLQASHGQMRIEALAQELTVSARQLERDFTRGVGLTPKAFARVVRFQRVFRSLQAGEARWADVAAESGYSDQSHLVNEFRAFAGLPPREYFAQQGGMGAVFAE